MDMKLLVFALIVLILSFGTAQETDTSQNLQSESE